MRITVLVRGAMCCIELDVSHVFVYRSFSNAHVDAFADILRRDVLA